MQNNNKKRVLLKKRSPKSNKNIVKIENHPHFLISILGREIGREKEISEYIPGMFIQRIISGKENAFSITEEDYYSDKSYYISQEIDAIYMMYQKDKIYISFPISVTLTDEVISYDVVRCVYDRFRYPLNLIVPILGKDNLFRDFEFVSGYIRMCQNCVDTIVVSFDYERYVSNTDVKKKELLKDSSLDEIAEEITRYLKLVPKYKRELNIVRSFFKEKKEISFFFVDDESKLYVIFGNIILLVYLSVFNGKISKDIIVDDIFRKLGVEGEDFSISIYELLDILEDKMYEQEANYYELYLVSYGNNPLNRISSLSLEAAECTEEVLEKEFAMAITNSKLLTAGFGIHFDYSVTNMLSLCVEFSYFKGQSLNSRLVDTISIENVSLEKGIRHFADIAITCNSIVEEAMAYHKSNVIDMFNPEVTADERCNEFSRMLKQRKAEFRQKSDLNISNLSYMVNDDIVKGIVFRILERIEIEEDCITIMVIDSDVIY